jgi:hypothetical protein
MDKQTKYITVMLSAAKHLPNSGKRQIDATPQKMQVGEKWESDKKRNKTQQVSHHAASGFYLI